LTEKGGGGKQGLTAGRVVKGGNMTNSGERRPLTKKGGRGGLRPTAGGKGDVIRGSDFFVSRRWGQEKGESTSRILSGEVATERGKGEKGTTTKKGTQLI